MVNVRLIKHFLIGNLELVSLLPERREDDDDVHNFKSQMYKQG